jgi:hypothetical protein
MAEEEVAAAYIVLNDPTHSEARWADRATLRRQAFRRHSSVRERAYYRWKPSGYGGVKYSLLTPFVNV